MPSRSRRDNQIKICKSCFEDEKRVEDASSNLPSRTRYWIIMMDGMWLPDENFHSFLNGMKTIMKKELHSCCK